MKYLKYFESQSTRYDADIIEEFKEAVQDLGITVDLHIRASGLPPGNFTDFKSFHTAVQAKHPDMTLEKGIEEHAFQYHIDIGKRIWRSHLDTKNKTTSMDKVDSLKDDLETMVERFKDFTKLKLVECRLKWNTTYEIKKGVQQEVVKDLEGLIIFQSQSRQRIEKDKEKKLKYAEKKVS